MFCASALPIIGAACCNPRVKHAARNETEMLSGAALGAALKVAMDLKGVNQADVAKEFDVKQPSVSEWIKYGRIAKRHIPHLVAYFSSHVGPAHWGLPASWQAAEVTMLMDEAELLLHYRAMPEDAKSQAIGFLKGLLSAAGRSATGTGSAESRDGLLAKPSAQPLAPKKRNDDAGPADSSGAHGRPKEP